MTFEAQPRSHFNGGNKRTPKASTPKGHEAFLKALEASGAQVTCEFTDGTSMTGTVKHSDKFTISMKVTNSDESYQVYVLFKHDIRLFFTPGIANAETTH